MGGKMMKFRAVAYYRYSSKMQTEMSIEGQRRVVTNYAKKNNFLIVNEYIDRAKSGKNGKRPSFQQMISDLSDNQQQISFVLVYKLDRFARNETLHRKYEQTLNDNDIVLLSATEEVNDVENLGSKIMKSISLIINEEEVKKISQNVSRGKKETAYKCLWCGGIPPLGFDVEKNTQKLKINKDEAKIVRYAFKLRAEGFSYSYIIDKLNQKGYKTKRGNNFSKNSLFEIFRNVKYKGVYEYNRAAAKSIDGKFNRHASKDDSEIIQIKDGCPRIVSDEIWDKVNQMSKRHTNVKPKGDYLLSGLVFCKCGTAMQVNRRNNHKTEYFSFFCPKHKNGDDCDAKEINLKKLEKFVLSELSKIIFSKENIEKFIEYFPKLNERREKQHKIQAREIKRQIKSNSNKISNLVSEIGEGCCSDVSQILKNKISDMSKENKKLTRRLTRLSHEKISCPSKSEIKELQSSFFGFMTSENRLPSCKAFLQKVIEKILILDDKIEIIFKL